MRLIDADALEKDYRDQFEAVYKHTRDAVKPSDFYIEREAAYNKELMRLEMEAFCEYLQGRATVDAEPVRHGKWITFKDGRGCELRECSQCHYAFRRLHPSIYCSNCGAKMDGGDEE